MYNKRISRVYWNMKTRCYNPSSNKYNAYGARGIKVCDEWKNSFKKFKEWALSNGYGDNLTIDRINNDGNYEPSNCRWVTNKQNTNNTRKNRFITAFGETDTLSNMARKYDVNVDCLWSRLNAGWNVEKALSTTVRKGNYRKAKLEELKGE